MIARVFEEAGLATVMIALVREHVEKVKPPRALYVPYPFGSPLGKPLDKEHQDRVLAAALGLLGRQMGPVLVDFDDPDYIEQGGAPTQYSEIAAKASSASRPDVDPATETTRIRQYYMRWVEQHGGRTSVGATRIPPSRFRGIIRFLEEYERAGDADMRERPSDVVLGEWLRLCALDLRAMFSEAKMAMQPGITSEEIDLWFWGGTSTAYLLQRVKDRMEASDDESIVGAAYGVAR